MMLRVVSFRCGPSYCAKRRKSLAQAGRKDRTLVMMLGASCRCTSGANRAAINPAAVEFSPYGATCKAASQNPGTRRRPFQESQRS